jgi:hypothetical protein
VTIGPDGLEFWIIVCGLGLEILSLKI